MDSLISESKTPLIFIVTLFTLITLLAGYFYSNLKSYPGKKIPAGSFGFPVIGESIGFLRASKQDRVDKWLEKRVRKFGPLFKTSLFGSKMVVLSGQAGSRLVFQGGDNGISFHQPDTIVNILGKYNLNELSGAQHKLIRGAVVGFCQPESIQRVVGQVDSRVEKELLEELHGKDSIKIADLLKKIAFKVSWSTFFGFPDEIENDRVFEDFIGIMQGIHSVPIKFPGTKYNSGMKARARLGKKLSQLVMTKKQEMDQVKANENLLSSLVNLRDENGEPLDEDMLLDNILLFILASHDTIAVVVTLFIRYLSRDREVYNKVLQEQMEVMEAKQENENGRVSWKEIQMMKYTWRVVQELMRFRPPVSALFRHTTRDINFEGFHIPKGWKVGFFTSSTHMDAKIFEDPTTFDPSRFESSSKGYPPYTYLPFGAGPRICPGSEFAKVESMLVIHHFITKYEWKEMIPDEPITLNPMAFPAMGLPVRFHLKKRC